ncbi:MAG: glycosyltransferase family 4 protein [Patescibacteria group bacterium]
MKILYIITLLSWGGAQKYVFDLSSDLKDSFDVVISGGEENKGELAERILKENIRLITLKNLVRETRPLNDIKAIFEIKKMIESEKPDVVHLNSSKAGIVGSIAARLSKHKAKVVFTCHGWVFNEDLGFLKKKIYLFLEKFTGRFKDKIVCLTELDKKTALEKGLVPEEKLSVIYNGISEIHFFSREEARKKLGLPQEKKIVGTLANFFPAKGLEYLIEASRSFDNSLTIVIGDGLLRKKLEEKIIDSNLQDKFLLLGKIDEASRYLKALDVFILTSTKEGLPFSLLEAMSAGLPIVTTNVGGIPEIINERNGILIEPKNPKIISEKVNLLIHDLDLRERLSFQAKADVKERFTKKKMTEQTAREY